MPNGVDRIPWGDFCYSVLAVRPGEVLDDDFEEFGRSLRHARYDREGRAKRVLCPYWRRTAHGTVRCEHLGVECVEEEEGAMQRAFAHFGGTEEMRRRTRHSWELPDELKICRVHRDRLKDVVLDAPDRIDHLHPLHLEEMAGWLKRAEAGSGRASDGAVRATEAYFRERFGIAAPTYENVLGAIDSLADAAGSDDG